MKGRKEGRIVTKEGKKVEWWQRTERSKPNMRAHDKTVLAEKITLENEV